MIQNSVTIQFITDKPLTEKQADTLRSILALQIEEPQDLQGNEEEWSAINIATSIQVEALEEVCEDCENGTDIPCDFCIEEDKRKAMGLGKVGK